MASDHNARHYTSPGSYLLPADEQERHRLAVQSSLVIRMFGQPILPPVQVVKGTQILDVATGSGAWAYDVLKTYPTASQATIHCVDIGSRLFPDAPPPNMNFAELSVLGLPVDWSNKFHVVHQRLLLASLKYNEWPVAVGEIFRVTAPGGWVQFCEVNPAETVAGPSSKKAVELAGKLASKKSIDLFGCAHRIPSLLVQAGFVDVNVDKRLVKLRKWGGQDGVDGAKGQIGAWRGMKTPILAAGGLGIVKNEAEFDALMDETEMEWEKKMTEEPYFTTTARKPDV